MKFLNTTVEIQNIKLLPFEIPNPIDDSLLEVVGKPIYAEYDVDLYFLR